MRLPSGISIYHSQSILFKYPSECQNDILPDTSVWIRKRPPHWVLSKQIKEKISKKYMHGNFHQIFTTPSAMRLSSVNVEFSKDPLLANS